MKLKLTLASSSPLFKKFIEIFAIAAFPLLALAVFCSCATTQEADKKQAQIAYDLGVNNFQNGRYREALHNFEQAVQFDSEFAPTYNGLGLLYHALGRFDEAITYYKRAIELDPKNSDFKNNLASVYIDQKQYDKAIPLLNEALSDLFYKTPFSAEGNLGWALYKKGETEEGIKRIRKSVILNPNFCLGYKNLGIIYEEIKDDELAEKYYTKYVKKCPKVADAHYRFGLVMARRNKLEEAKVAFQECKLYAAESSDLADECEKLEKTVGVPK